jgi:hypothetical protein
MRDMGPELRSPIKDRPLRRAGQSLEQTLQDLIEDQFETPALLALILALFAGLEWLRSYTGKGPQPLAFALAAGCAAGFAAWRYYRVRPRLRLLRQAIDGERVVGEFLERLREKRYHVFHDLIGAGFNVDHVLIGPAGVFTVETKTWSKPVRGDARIGFDGQQITRDGSVPDRDPVVQASAQAGWLATLLRESTGKPFDVRPVIVFPGWFVEQLPSKARVWALNPKALPHFLDHEPQWLAADDIALASFHLSRFVRSGEAHARR